MSSSEFYQAEKFAEPLLSAGLVYDYEQTPAQFFAQAPAERLGTNCKVVGHQFTREVLGAELPTDLQIAEAYLNSDSPNAPLRRVHPTENLRMGDWILYGRQSRMHPRLVTPRFDAEGNMLNWRELAINHQGVYLGSHRGNSMILHATPANGVAISAQNDILRDRRTEIIYEVLRTRSTS
jgi:hypothetical protein